MSSNVQIDSVLLAKAQKMGGFKTKKDTVNQALSEFIRRHEQLAILELFGTMDLVECFDHKKMRGKR